MEFYFGISAKVLQIFLSVTNFPVLPALILLLLFFNTRLQCAQAVCPTSNLPGGGLGGMYDSPAKLVLFIVWIKNIRYSYSTNYYGLLYRL